MPLRTLAGLACVFAFSAVSGDEPARNSAASAESQGRRGDIAQPQRPLAELYAQILADFESQAAGSREDAAKARNQPSGVPAGARRPPDEAAYSRRIIDLAERSPEGPASRDALLWVINKPHKGVFGAYGDQFARASALLVRHHGDDPEAVRIGLTLDHKHSFPAESLLFGFYAAAKGRESQGLARMALAQYLANKAPWIVRERKSRGRPKVMRATPEGGKVVEVGVEIPDEPYAYRLHVRQCDPEVVRAEAVRLFEEVISDFKDVPYVTRDLRDLESLLKETGEPGRTFKTSLMANRLAARPLTNEERSQIEKTRSRKRTLGEEAEARLDEVFNVSVGKPAPEIDGVDLDGKPLKLSDYRGKVVALVFWGTWCGPCMAEVPHEREMAERLKGRQFALLGVDCSDDRDTARKVVERERMDWPSWYDGADREGAIVGLYHIRQFPTVIVIDARGVIRARDVYRQDLDRVVERLLEELKPQ